LAADRLARLEGGDALATLLAGEGRVLELDGEKVAVYRNTRDELTVPSGPQGPSLTLVAAVAA
jgi:hypothetical protein